VETDAFDYALAAILSTRTPDGEIHPIAFHSRTFSGAELNYDVHDKELLAIYEAFKAWRHYLEGSGDPIDVITDHKNLEYFSTTKVLTRRQVRWSEYLSAFNLVIRFRPGRLGAKPDALTRRWDVYPKEGRSDYATVNPHNFRPVFAQEQLTASLRATHVSVSHTGAPIIRLRAAASLDIVRLHDDIRAALVHDSAVTPLLPQLIPTLVAPADTFTPFTSPPYSYDVDGYVRRDGRIYVPSVGDLRLRILQFKHDHSVSGHPGVTNTTKQVMQEYTWPGIRQFVKAYVNSCVTCKRGKAPRHKPYGFLKPLPPPPRPWDSISMDFIEQLPPSGGFTAILVVVDRLTKQGIFIPTVDTITSEQLAHLFIIHVYSKHGCPNNNTSDRGVEFISRFTRALGDALNMRLHFTSGYHPEANGQAERTNQTLEQYIRMYCNYRQDDWSSLLPLAEFAYNNTPNATTGVTPFFANKGYHPNITVHPEREMASARAREFALDLDALHRMLQQNMAAAQEYQRRYANADRLPAPEIPIGSQVYVRAEFFRVTRPSKKLSDKMAGPFEVVDKPGTHSYTLRLPAPMRLVHPVFHVAMLEPAVPNTITGRVQSPPPPETIDGEEHYEITAIRDSAINKRYRMPLRYLVEWKGYEETGEGLEWISADDLNAPDAISDFHLLNPDKPGPVEKLVASDYRGARVPLD
jgi:hypothetical protein